MFPGEDGRITFSSIRDGDSEISTMRPDGTGVKQLTRNAVEDFSSAFPPDGEKIVFAREVVFIMNADGTGVKRLAFNSRTDFNPICSPNGKKIAPRASFKLAEHRSLERESRESETSRLSFSSRRENPSRSRDYSGWQEGQVWVPRPATRDLEISAPQFGQGSPARAKTLSWCWNLPVSPNASW